MVRHDSDNDSLGLDNDKGFVQAVEEAQKESKEKRPLLISVSGDFVNVAEEYTYYVVTFPKSGKTFYLKLDHWKTMLSVALKKRKVLNPA